MTPAFRQDIEKMYGTAERSSSLSTLVPELYTLLRRNEDSLTDVTYRYRMVATDTGYACAFALNRGQFAELSAAEPVDVTVTGTEAHLLAVFQRKLNPAVGLVMGKFSISGSKAALMKLAAFL